MPEFFKFAFALLFSVMCEMLSEGKKLFKTNVACASWSTGELPSAFWFKSLNEEDLFGGWFGTGLIFQENKSNFWLRKNRGLPTPIFM